MKTTFVIVILALLNMVFSDGSANAGSRQPGSWEYVRVESNSSQNFTELFFRDELAQVWIRGDGDTDLDLFIFDENGSLICESVSRADVEHCSWIPLWNAWFSIEVHNLGNVYNLVTVTTN